MRSVRDRNLAPGLSRQPRLQRGEEALLVVVLRILCLAFLLAIAGGCDHGHTTKPVVAPAVPRALADGSLPGRLHDFRGHPVLRAKELSARTVPVRPQALRQPSASILDSESGGPDSTDS